MAEEMEAKIKSGDGRKRIGYANESFYYAFSGEQSTMIRAELTLTEAVEPEALRTALSQALLRYPNFRQTLAIGEDNTLYYVPKEGAPRLDLEDGRQLYLATAETNGYLFRVVYEGKRLVVCLHHGLTDGKGALEFTKTLLYDYLRALGRLVRTGGLVLTNGEAADPTEQEDSFATYGDPAAKPLGLYQNQGAFRIPEPLFDERQPYCRRLRLRCSMQALLQLAKRYGSTPVPILSILIARVLRRLYDVGEQPVTGYIPVNLRPYYHSKALNNFSLAVTLPYKARTEAFDWDVQATIQRGILDLQAQKENFAYKMAQLCAAGEQTARLPLPAPQKQALLAAKLREKSREQYSYLLSYLGALELPPDLRAVVQDMEIYIPSYLIPFTICALALDDQLTLTCTQGFEADKLVSGLYEMLQELGIAAEYEDLGIVRTDKLLLYKIAKC